MSQLTQGNRNRTKRSREEEDDPALHPPFTVTHRMFPWASDRLNIVEVCRRLEFGQSPYNAEARKIAIFRQWKMWGGTNYRCWSHFVPMKVYMIAAAPYQCTQSSVTSAEANVLRFIEYVKAPVERVTSVDRYIDSKKFTASHGHNDEDSDDDVCDNYYEYLRELEDIRVAAKLYYVFEDLTADRRRYTIDIFGRSIPSATGEFMTTCVRIYVLDIGSNAWHTRSRESASSRAFVCSRMQSIRRGWELGIVAEVAARTIQQAWRDARADPEHPLCCKRLRAEYDEMVDM